MARWKVPRGKKKVEAGRGTAIGCVTVIVLLLLFVFWMFRVALTPG